MNLAYLGTNGIDSNLPLANQNCELIIKCTSNSNIP